MFNKIYDKLKNIILNIYPFLITVGICIFLFTFELPYVVYRPGGIVELEKRIEIDDHEANIGSLSMSYVSMMRGTIPALGLALIIPNWDIVDDKELTNDEISVDELMELEKLYMKSSLDNATILAYEKADKKLDITKGINTIIYIAKEAKSDLEVYDEIISVEGQNVNSIDDIKEIIGKMKVNDKVKIVVLRDGKEVETTSEIYEVEGELKVGISTLTTYEYETEPKIEISTKSSESGSSGGLMLSLAIYDALSEGDLTKGKKIAGTGTIDVEGNVGEIDGVKYKVLGAVKKDIEIFLCPKENYKEALKVKKENNLDIEIKSVETFNEAVEYLENM